MWPYNYIKKQILKEVIAVISSTIVEHRIKQQKLQTDQEVFFRIQSKISTLHDLKEQLDERFNLKN